MGAGANIPKDEFVDDLRDSDEYGLSESDIDDKIFQENIDDVGGDDECGDPNVIESEDDYPSGKDSDEDYDNKSSVPVGGLARRREPDELVPKQKKKSRGKPKIDPTKLRRHQATIKCSKCGVEGHNKRYCPLNNAPEIPTQGEDYSQLTQETCTQVPSKLQQAPVKETSAKNHIIFSQLLFLVVVSGGDDSDVVVDNSGTTAHGGGQ
ncbi:hypothetical protein DH2020_032096 [Rehmannia glutinosa]|uniref:CCHC-type domain-containing protein n=1 Tax=Rehmannia glutinosa TaxID=99300 RepID=A0ABR0VIJ6_REHGL